MLKEKAMNNKEQIIIDGIQFNKFGDFYVDYDLSGKFQSISSSAKEYKILKSLIKQFARRTQECEDLKGKYKNVLDLAKQNADANEYCLQELEQENYRYRKALEEIEKELKEDIYCENQECGCDDYEECLRCTKNIILGIINKAKGKVNE